MERFLDEYRKFLPQVAYVLLAAWALISDRVQDGRAIDGVTYVAVAVAVVQALAVVLPASSVVKTVGSLVLALAQVATSALTDNSVSVAEGFLIGTAFLSWATSAAAVNRLTTAGRLAGVVRPD